MAPTEIRLVNGRRTLEIEWPDGARSHLQAGHLRANCRSSRAIRSRHDGADTKPAGDLQMTDVGLIGLYGINLAFSDGDDRGIYPWSYLRQLDEGQHT
jgi:DUF971 family protein